MKRISLLALATLFSAHGWANLPDARSESAGGSGSGLTDSPQFGGSRMGDDLGTNMVGTSQRELACLITKADPVAKDGQVDKVSAGLESALKKIKFKPGTFTRTALMHFLSQSLIETGHLKSTEQKGAPSEEKKGYGLIQVTGSSNLRKCSQCVEECSPGSGHRMVADKSGTIGDSAPDKTDAALVSLCWWRMNMSQNADNVKYANNNSKSASEAVTQIVNAGGVGKKVTDGQKNLDARSKIFTELVKIDSGGSCRNI